MCSAHLMDQQPCLAVKKEYGANINLLSVIEVAHTELVALFVIAMEVDRTSLEHPSGNYTLRDV